MPSSSCITLALVGSAAVGLALGLLLPTDAAQWQVVPEVAVPVTPLVAMPPATAALGTAPQVAAPDSRLVDANDAASEADLEIALQQNLNELGHAVSAVGPMAVPLLGAVVALLFGWWARAIMSGKSGANLRPMEMEATEASPLTRRGALAAVVAALPFAASASPALAAKSGGRIGGGGGFRSFKAQRVAPPPRPPIGGGNVYIAPSPPVVVSPFGFAPAVPFGFGFSTGELLALSAIELGEAFVREQRRQEYLRQQLEIQRQLGRDQAQIESLQQQLAAQEQRMRDLQGAMQQKGVPAPAQ